MEKRDVELIRKYVATDSNLRKLYEEHLDLEKKLGDLNGRSHLTPVEETERSKLKKIKLKGRDQMEMILKRYRTIEKDARG